MCVLCVFPLPSICSYEFDIYLHIGDPLSLCVCVWGGGIAVKWLIASKINVFVHIICMCTVYIYYVYINTHIQYIFWKYLHVYIYIHIHIIYIIYNYCNIYCKHNTISCIYIIIYLLFTHKSRWFTLLCVTKKEMFRRILLLLFSIQWKHTVTRGS